MCQLSIRSVQIEASLLPNSSAAAGPFAVTIFPSTVTASPVYCAPHSRSTCDGVGRATCPEPVEGSHTVAFFPRSTPARARIVGAMQMAPSTFPCVTVSRAIRCASVFSASSAAPGPPMKATRSKSPTRTSRSATSAFSSPPSFPKQGPTSRLAIITAKLASTSPFRVPAYSIS